MERELQVLIDLDGRPVFVGRLWARNRQGKDSCTFAYDSAWVDKGFALSPSLPLGRGPQNTPYALFGVFSDAAPDSWGEHLMRFDERATAKKEGREVRYLFGIDYLAAVNDETRMGALRFRNPGEENFLTVRGKPVPPVIDLPALMNAAMTVDNKGKVRDADLRLVLDPGSALGGARPKAVVRGKDGALLIAKFEKKTDDWPLIRWEAATLAMARAAGISTPDFELKTVSQKAILLMSRFDRRGAGLRVAFMSAMSAIGAHDHEAGHSYLELADVIRQESDQPAIDLRELWRRVVFNILVSNTDDHLRNHAFLWSGTAWRLSPAYDVNPTPISVRPRVHQIAIDDDDPTGDLDTAFKVAPRYGLSKTDARAIAGEVAAVVAGWRAAAAAVSIGKDKLEHMESAFEHDDLKRALANRVTLAVQPPTPVAKRAKSAAPPPPPAPAPAPAQPPLAPAAKSKTPAPKAKKRAGKAAPKKAKRSASRRPRKTS